MALTAEQTTQATQLSNGLPWIYPSASNTDFWGQYFSGSGPSLTPAEQASGISIGPMTASPSPAPMPAPAPQPQVLPGVDDNIGYWPEEREGYVPPGAPVQYQSELIRGLREASPGFGTNNPGVTMLANPANSKTVIDFKRAPPPAPYQPPPAPPAPTPAPTPAPPPSGGGGDGGGGPGGPPVIGPGIPPRLITVPDDTVPDYTDDLWGPDVGPPAPPDPDVGPPAPDVAETFPVPDPTPPDVRDLPPLPPEDEVATTFPVPDRPPLEFVDLPPLLPDDELEIPDYTDDLGTPIYDEIPEGEIDVTTGVTNAYQAARDALVNADTVTQVDDAEELEIPPFDESVFELIDTPPPVPAPEGSGESGGGSGDVYVRPSGPLESVSENPLDEWDWIELEEPEIPPPEIPSASMDFNFSDADLMEFLFGDFGGGGGGASNNFNVISLE